MLVVARIDHAGIGKEQRQVAQAGVETVRHGEVIIEPELVLHPPVGRLENVVGFSV